MKVTRIALAVLTLAVLGACSSDVTAPSNAKPTTASQDLIIGPRP
jgi:hypothetical protein